MESHADSLKVNGLLMEEMLLGVGVAVSLLAEKSSKGHRYGRWKRRIMILTGKAKMNDKVEIYFPGGIWRTSYCIVVQGGVPSLIVRISAGR